MTVIVVGDSVGVLVSEDEVVGQMIRVVGLYSVCVC